MKMDNGIFLPIFHFSIRPENGINGIGRTVIETSKIHTSPRGHVTPGCIPDVIDYVIVVEFRSKSTVVGVGGFPGDDVIAAARQNDSEADDENEAGGNAERRHANKQRVRWAQVDCAHLRTIYNSCYLRLCGWEGNRGPDVAYWQLPPPGVHAVVLWI